MMEYRRGYKTKTIKQVLRKKTDAWPAADALDEDALPCGKEPGANQIGLKICATCGKPPTSLVGTRHENFMPNGAFLFRDELSAKEYYISGMCQACQDSVFNSEEE